MINSNLRWTVALSAMLSGLVANAQEATETPAEESKGKFTVSGYVDTYYLYNTNDPTNNSIQGRVFDLQSKSFNLGLAQTQFKYETEKSGAVLDLVYGPNAELGNFGNKGTAFSIKQAYAYYMFTDKLKMTAGQFGTHIGYELIDAPLNYNYSLSYLFGNGPFYHTGLKFDYAISEKAAVMLGVVNGWDQLQDANGRFKSYTAQVFLSPKEGMNIYLNGIVGNESGGYSAFGVFDNNSMTYMGDLTASYAVSDKVNLGLNAATGFYSNETALKDTKAKNWGGAALYGQYMVSDVFSLGLRQEYWEDVMGIRYVKTPGFKVNATTLTGTFSLDNGSFLLKPEVRFDAVSLPNSGKYFETNKYSISKDDNDKTTTQLTVGLVTIYKF